jgi:hypothetical protein
MHCYFFRTSTPNDSPASDRSDRVWPQAHRAQRKAQTARQRLLTRLVTGDTVMFNEQPERWFVPFCPEAGPSSRAVAFARLGPGANSPRSAEERGLGAGGEARVGRHLRRSTVPGTPDRSRTRHRYGPVLPRIMSVTNRRSRSPGDLDNDGVKDPIAATVTVGTLWHSLLLASRHR